MAKTKKKRKKKSYKPKPKKGSPKAAQRFESLNTALQTFKVMGSYEAELEQLKIASGQDVMAVCKAVRDTPETQAALERYFWETAENFIRTRGIDEHTDFEARNQAEAAFQSLLKDIIGVPIFAQRVMTVYTRIRQNSRQIAKLVAMTNEGKANEVPKEFEEEINEVSEVVDLDIPEGGAVPAADVPVTFEEL